MNKLRQLFNYLKIRKIIRIPGSIIARMLGIRCPNCGADTLSEFLLSCTHCGYPSPSSLECPNCGLHMAHTDRGLCPKCGADLSILQSAPTVGDSPLKTDDVPEVIPVVSPPAEEIKAVEAVVATTPVEPVAIIASPMALVPEVMQSTPSTALQVPEPITQAKSSETQDIPDVIELPPPQTKEIPVVGEDFSISVEQLTDIFKIDITKADAIYKEKVLRVKGTIEMVAVDDQENHYIILTGFVPSTEQKVQCVFDKKYEPVLSRLIPGQKITVLGRYNGYDIYIRLIDSLPVA